MRDWFNAIFSFIGTTSITDEEYDSINFLNIEVNVYNQASYDELAKVLAGRETVSDLQEKLAGVFTAKGYNPTPLDTSKSEIFIGSPL